MLASSTSFVIGLAMNRRILIQVSAPAVLLGLLLFAACLLSAWYANRLQAGLNEILNSNIASLEASQQLEVNLHQLRFHSFLYLVDPDPELLGKIHEDESLFEDWLHRAAAVGQSEEEEQAIVAIGQAYDDYKKELQALRAEAKHGGPRRDLRALAEAHPTRQVTDLCVGYAQLNAQMVRTTVDEGARLSTRLNLTMLLLGLGGPLAGLLGGFGIARGLSRSLYRLSVRVQDMAQSLEHDVANVQLNPEDDLAHLDQQLDRVVERVAAVTERLQAQQRAMLRAQQLAAVGQLAAGVAHEIRNPLTAIKMLVEAGMRPQRARPFSEENLRVIHGEVLRLERTVQGLLDFARPPAPRRQPTDAVAVCRRAVALVRARAEQQKVTIVENIPAGPLVIDADPDQLQSVLVNLLFNALDAMPRGGTLAVTLEALLSGGLSCRVSDTGTGIRPDIQEHLFTPFTSTKPTGSGLGLSVCKRVVEEHGGRITASNRPEGGAAFTFTLPGQTAKSNGQSAG